MTSNTAVNVTLRAERKAAEAEGIYRPTRKDKALIARIRTIAAEVKALTSERDALIQALKESMDSRAAEKLFDGADNVAQYISVRGERVDVDAMRAAMPEVVQAMETAQAAYDEAARSFIVTTVTPHARFKVL